jgi:hypothetical protein
MQELMEINLGKNITELFMEKRDFEMKTETWGHLACKRDQVAWSSKQATPPKSVWVSVAASASPSMHTFIFGVNDH